MTRDERKSNVHDDDDNMGPIVGADMSDATDATAAKLETDAATPTVPAHAAAVHSKAAQQQAQADADAMDDEREESKMGDTAQTAAAATEAASSSAAAAAAVPAAGASPSKKKGERSQPARNSRHDAGGDLSPH